MMEELNKESWSVTDLNSAEWALEKLAEQAKAKELVEQQYKKMVDRYDAWRKGALDDIESSETFFQIKLAEWASNELAGSKKKSVTLPSGRVGFRAGQKSFMLDGEKVSSTNPDLIDIVDQDDSTYIETKRSVRWGDYKKTLHVADDGRVVTADGEIIPGMICQQGEPSFYFKLEE